MFLYNIIIPIKDNNTAKLVLLPLPYDTKYSVGTNIELDTLLVDKVDKYLNTTEEDFYKFCKSSPLINSVTPFLETQGLLVGKKGKQQAALLRAVPNSIIYEDFIFR